MATSSTPKKTVLDRSVVKILPGSLDDTPSRKDGVSVEQERLHRLHGTFLIESACQILNILVFPTAAVIFHRFFHRVSLTAHDVWSVAMASTLLAAKTEETQLSFRQVILAYCHLYRRQTLVLVEDDEVRENIVQNPSVAVSPKSSSLNFSQRMTILHKFPAVPELGAVYKEWHDSVVHAEAIVLRQLGFMLYWIPDSHPHKFTMHFLEVLDLLDNTIVARKAWEYSNQSLKLDLCVRFDASAIGSVAIYLALVDNDVIVPETFLKFCAVADENFLLISNCLLGINDAVNWDITLSSKAFIKSKIPDGSFNDPGSYLWEMMIL
jgi:hypothetical protein